jgi:hydrogenase maturation protease
MPRILIIGFGNTLRGDDGFGPLAAEHIAARAPPGVEVMSVHQLGPELALDIRAADFVVFLDAAQGPDPGRLAAAPVVAHDLSPSSVMHGLDPGGLLALTRAVYGRVPAAALVTAIAADFAHGDTISTEVRNAAKKAAEAIVKLAESGHLDTQTLGEALG